MTLSYHSMNFHDSDFDSRNESSIFEDTSELNVAFIASPGKSISYILDESVLNDRLEMLIDNDANDRDQMVNKLAEKSDRAEMSCHGNNVKTAEVIRSGSSMENDMESYSLSNPGYLCKNAENWVSTSKRIWMPRFGDLDSEIGNLQLLDSSETEKRQEGTECIFASTCLDEFQKTSDYRKTGKRSFSEMDDESEIMAPKIRNPVSRSNHVYHELSTIPEVDSMVMDESLVDSNKCDSLLMQDLKNSKVPKANDSVGILMTVNAPSNFPAYILKLMQNEHLEMFMQKPGILEESDLTLISTDLDSLSVISEVSSKKGHCHSYYKIKHFDKEESPSLISFEQHELSCMRNCNDD